MTTMTLDRPTRHALGHAVETVRWAPAPRWEGPASSRVRFVGYLVGSMTAWTLAGLGLSAALGVLTGLGG